MNREDRAESAASGPSSDGDSGYVVLDAEVVIGSFEALKARLDAELLSGMPALLDGGSVRRIDAAGLQLLVAFVLEARRRGPGAAWVRVSNELKAAAGVTGLAGVLDFRAAGARLSTP